MKTLVLSLTCALAVLAIAHIEKAQAGDSAKSKVQLALNWKAEPQFGGFYAAQVEGYFKKQGLEVIINEGGVGTPVVQMVAAKKYDFGIASADEVVISRANGTNVVALFAAYQINPQGIMVHASSTLKSIADVMQSSQTVALQKGLPYAQFLLHKYPKYKAQIVPYSGGIGLFLADKDFSQQCFAPSEPLVAKKKGAAVQTFLVADEGFNPYTTVLITRDDIVKSDPELVKKMTQAVRDGWTSYLKSPEKTDQFMATLNKSMDALTFTDMAHAQEPFVRGIAVGSPATVAAGSSAALIVGQMTTQRWQTLAQQLKELGLAKREVPAGELFVAP